MTPITNDALYVCPECGSASVEFSSLVGGSASCSVCGWAGEKRQLLTVPFDNAMGSPLEVMMAMRNDIRKAFASSSREFIHFLIKWGFLPSAERHSFTVDPKMAIRYMNAIAQACLSSIFEERQKIETEGYGQDIKKKETVDDDR